MVAFSELVCVVSGLCSNGITDAKANKLAFDAGDVVADVNHCEGQSMGACEFVDVNGAASPFGVITLQSLGHPSQMAMGHIRHTAAHGEAAAGELVCQTEHDTALQSLAKS